jgi:hypothetical protein
MLDAAVLTSEVTTQEHLVVDGMTDVPRDPWRVDRVERDLGDLRTDLKTGLREVQSALSLMQSSINGLQVQLPLTYVSRTDVIERIKYVSDATETRCTALEKDVAELRALIQRLIFTIIGALITSGLALLGEVLRLLGGGH